MKIASADFGKGESMKVICNQSELVNSLGTAFRAVSSKTSFPILECFLLEAKDSNLVITANDMELGIEIRILCRVDNPGRIAVNAKIFYDIIRKLPEDIVFIEVDQDYVIYITCGKAKFKIAGLPGDDFPPLPSYERVNGVKMSQFTLKELISKTIFAVSLNEADQIRTGECFEITGSKLRVIALDGHRAAIRTIDLREEYANQTAVIPGKTLLEISKILSGNVEDEVNIFFMKNLVIFEMNHTIVLSRLIEGRFYNLNPMLNSGYTTKVSLNKREFADCIDRASLLVKESERRPVIIDIKDGVLAVNMKSSLGTMDDELTIYKEGNDITIGLNPKFITDVLRSIDDEDITLFLTTVGNPCFIRNSDNSYIYLILPVNIGNR